MPIACVPLEVFGHVFKALDFPSQAQLRAVCQASVYAFTIAVVNERFIECAGTKDDPKHLGDYDTRWFVVHRFRLPTHALHSAFNTVAVSVHPQSATLSRLAVERVFLLSPTDVEQVVECPIRLADSRVKHVIFVGFTKPLRLPEYFLSYCHGLESLVLPKTPVIIGDGAFRGLDLETDWSAAPNAVHRTPAGPQLWLRNVPPRSGGHYGDLGFPVLHFKPYVSYY